MIIDLISLTERLHRRFIALVKVALDELGITDINATQAAILCHIGDGVSSLRELRTRGYYSGTNPTYNVQKLVRAGYLVRARQGHDRRSTGVRLTEKGLWLRSQLMALHHRQLEALIEYGMSQRELESAGMTLDRLERFITVARRPR